MDSATKISLTIAVCAAAAVALLLPEEKSRTITSSFKRMLGDSAELCKEHHKSGFVNPDSVYVLSSEKVENTLTVKVSSSNRGGGRSPTDLRCTIGPDGRLDLRSTLLDNISWEIKQISARRKSVSDCQEAGGNKYICESKFPEPVE